MGLPFESRDTGCRTECKVNTCFSLHIEPVFQRGQQLRDHEFPAVHCGILYFHVAEN